jgi:Tol biopolymer transport system component
VYFSSDRSGRMNLWREAIGSDGAPDGPLQQVTTGAGHDVEPAISRDGKRIAFTTLRQNADLWRLPVSPSTGLAAGAPEPLVATTREDSRGAWSPDGTAIAFNSDRTGEMNLWLYSLLDKSTRRLTSGSGGDFQPNWSPDGRTIAFFSSRSGSPNIWKLALDGGKPTRLTSNNAINANPFFSPDGSRIAFQSDQGGRNELWIMNADGSETRRLTNVGVTGHFMRWTASGDAIVFRCTCGGKAATMIVPAAGGDPRVLLDQKGGAHISFSPDRSRIMDVLGHKVLWVSPIEGEPQKVFEFPDPGVRIDYPVWSPDGKSVLFDRLQPGEGDIWVMTNFE